MTLSVPPVVTKVELEAALLPANGETVSELAVRASSAGYTVKEIKDDRVVVLYVTESVD